MHIVKTGKQGSGQGEKAVMCCKIARLSQEEQCELGRHGFPGNMSRLRVSDAARLGGKKNVNMSKASSRRDQIYYKPLLVIFNRPVSFPRAFPV
jgi:hypothetical protein